MAPSCSKSSQIPRPIPEAPPVTNAIQPGIFITKNLENSATKSAALDKTGRVLWTGTARPQGIIGHTFQDGGIEKRGLLLVPFQNAGSSVEGTRYLVDLQ